MVARRIGVHTPGQQDAVSLAGQDGQGIRVERRGQQDFQEAVADGLGHVGVHFPIAADDAAGGGVRIGVVGALVCLRGRGRHGNAAWCLVLQDDHRQLVKFLHRGQCGVGVGEIVERQFLAVQLLGLYQVRAHGWCGGVQCRALVRIFPVAQGAFPTQNQGFLLGERRRLGIGSVEIGADGGIVGGRVLKCLQGQSAAQGEAGDTVVLLQLRQHVVVLVRLAHHRHVREILGRGAQHGHAADVNVGERLVQGEVAVSRHGLEGVEVDDDQIDERQVVSGGVSHLIGLVALGENAAVQAGMQGFDPAAEHLRQAGHVLHGHDRNAVILQGGCGAAGGQDFDVVAPQLLHKGDKALLVRHADEGALDFIHFVFLRDRVRHGCSG